MPEAIVVGNRFILGEQVGSGSMGVVFRAVDRATGLPVALKVLRDLGGVSMERFTREARALWELRHPAIVAYVAHGTTDAGEAYLVMNWVQGSTLASRLRHGPLRVDETVALGIRIAGALGAAHRAGIVHRDLKPENLMLEGGQVERVMLLDFGIARRKNLELEQLTMTGELLGTPGYMAPEQARGVAEVDARADVYALGAVLFHCLTGRMPFEGGSALSVLLKAGRLDEPPHPRAERPEVPEALDDLVASMLRRLPDQRPENGDVVHRVLEGIAAAMRPPPPPPGAWPAYPERRSAAQEFLAGGNRVVPPPRASAPDGAAHGPEGTERMVPIGRQVQAMPQPAGTPWSTFVGGALGLLAIGGVAFVVAWTAARRTAAPRPSEAGAAESAATASPPAGEAAASTSTASVSSAPPRPCASHRCEPFAVLGAADPAAVEVVEVLPAVRALARDVHPDAALRGVFAEGVIRGGTFDANAAAGVRFDFEHPGSTPTALPKALHVTIAGGEVRVSLDGDAPGVRRYWEKPLADPQCTAQRAWAAVVATGVPADAVARYGYHYPSVRPAWVFEDEQMQVWHRHVDPTTCVVFKASGLTPKPPPPPAASATPEVRDPFQ